MRTLEPNEYTINNELFGKYATSNWLYTYNKKRVYGEDYELTDDIIISSDRVPDNTKLFIYKENDKYLVVVIPKLTYEVMLDGWYARESHYGSTEWYNRFIPESYSGSKWAEYTYKNKILYLVVMEEDSNKLYNVYNPTKCLYETTENITGVVIHKDDTVVVEVDDMFIVYQNQKEVVKFGTMVSCDVVNGKLIIEK